MMFYTVLVALIPFCIAKTPDSEDVAAMLNTLQAKVEKLRNQVEMQDRKIAAQDLTIDALKTMMNETYALAEKNLEAINPATVDTLFLATISAETVAISDHEPIIFDTAPINPGGHYNTVLGAYTAPYTGYYQFSVTKRSNDGVGAFWLLIDEERYFYSINYSTNTYASIIGSATITMELTAGQIVRVENNVSTLIYGTNAGEIIQSYFTGHMLYAL